MFFNWFLLLRSSFLCGHVVPGHVVQLLPAEENDVLNDVDNAVIDNITRLRCCCKLVTCHGAKMFKLLSWSRSYSLGFCFCDHLFFACVVLLLPTEENNTMINDVDNAVIDN
jgi:hypothetical protein